MSRLYRALLAAVQNVLALPEAEVLQGGREWRRAVRELETAARVAAEGGPT